MLGQIKDLMGEENENRGCRSFAFSWAIWKLEKKKRDLGGLLVVRDGAASDTKRSDIVACLIPANTSASTTHLMCTGQQARESFRKRETSILHQKSLLGIIIYRQSQ